jgi:tetratricopeptide (TPR) repeat protein
MHSQKKQSVQLAKEARRPEAEAAPKATLWPSAGSLPHITVVLALGFIVLLTYSNTMHDTGFALDNKFIILEDSRLRDPCAGSPPHDQQQREDCARKNSENIRLIFTEDYWWPKAVSGLYRPLTTLSYRFNYTVLGNRDHAAGYHLVNFLLHWANTALVYFVALVLLGRVWPALFMAALFGTHPVATESVANIIGRSDLFATLWLLVGFLCYAKSTTVAANRDPRIVSLAMAGAISILLVGFVIICWGHPSWLPPNLQSWTSVTIALVALGASTLVLACLAGGWNKLLPLFLLMISTAIGVFCKESGVVVLGVVMLYDFVYRIRQKPPNQAAAKVGESVARFLGRLDQSVILRLSLLRGIGSLAGRALGAAWNWLINLLSNFREFALQGYVVLVAPILAMCYARAWVFQHLRPPELPWVDNPLAAPSVGFWTARLTAIKVVGRYFWLLLWPQWLSCDYSYNQIPIVNWHFRTWEDWQAIVALASVVIVLLVAIRNYHRNKPLFFFVFLFFGSFLPSSNLIPNPTFGQSLSDKTSWCIGSIMAERFMYTPLIGFAGCAVLAVHAICRRVVPQSDAASWVPRAALSLIVVAYGARAFFRNYDWEDDVRLWTSAVQVCPNSFKTHKSLAFALYEKDPEGKHSIDRIIAEAEKARDVTDKTQIVLLHLGAYYRLKGDSYAQRGTNEDGFAPTAKSMPWYQKSADALQKAVPLDKEFNDDNRRKELNRGRSPDQIPDIGNHEIYWNLGISYMRMSQYQLALDAYLSMRHLEPTNPEAYLSIASVYLASGHADDAVIPLLQVLLLDSGRTQAMQLLVDIYHQIDHEGCAVVMMQGQPRLNVDCPIVHNHMCTAYLGLVQVFLEAKQYDFAKRTMQNALQTYHCPPEPFQQLVSNQTSTVSSKP